MYFEMVSKIISLATFNSWLFLLKQNCIKNVDESVLLIIRIMDPILTLGLFAFVCVILIMFSVGFIFHCVMATLECVPVSVFSPPTEQDRT